VRTERLESETTPKRCETEQRPCMAGSLWPSPLARTRYSGSLAWRPRWGTVFERRHDLLVVQDRRTIAEASFRDLTVERIRTPLEIGNPPGTLTVGGSETGSGQRRVVSGRLAVGCSVLAGARQLGNSWLQAYTWPS
jgi:hypothetical protein